MRLMSTDTPPRRAATCPSSDVPAPNGTIARAVPGADAHEARRLVDVERVGDEIGRRGRVERLVGAVLPADVLAGEDAVGGERRGERVAERRDVGPGEAAGLGRRAHGPGVCHPARRVGSGCYAAGGGRRSPRRAGSRATGTTRGPRASGAAA